VACKVGNYNIVKYLVEHGAKINSKALYCAYCSRNENIIKYLIDHSAINILQHEISPFVELCKKGNENLVNYFINLGIDINEKNEHGQTALINACLNENEPIVKCLIDHGANVNIKYRDSTPLTITCEK